MNQSILNVCQDSGYTSDIMTIKLYSKPWNKFFSNAEHDGWLFELQMPDIIYIL